MQQRAILYSVDVGRKDALAYFQVPLAGVPVRIIGIEASVVLLSSIADAAAATSVQASPNGLFPDGQENRFSVRRSEKAGVLSLQSPDKADIFYQGEVYRQDRNIGFADFTLSAFQMEEWMQGRKRYAQEIDINTASPILEGYYRDTWGGFYGTDLLYRLNLIIWYENKKA